MELVGPRRVRSLGTQMDFGFKISAIIARQNAFMEREEGWILSYQLGFSDGVVMQ